MKRHTAVICEARCTEQQAMYCRIPSEHQKREGEKLYHTAGQSVCCLEQTGQRLI